MLDVERGSRLQDAVDLPSRVGVGIRESAHGRVAEGFGGVGLDRVPAEHDHHFPARFDPLLLDRGDDGLLVVHGPVAEIRGVQGGKLAAVFRHHEALAERGGAGRLEGVVEHGKLARQDALSAQILEIGEQLARFGGRVGVRGRDVGRVREADNGEKSKQCTSHGASSGGSRSKPSQNDRGRGTARGKMVFLPCSLVPAWKPATVPAYRGRLHAKIVFWRWCVSPTCDILQGDVVSERRSRVAPVGRALPRHRIDCPVREGRGLRAHHARLVHRRGCRRVHRRLPEPSVSLLAQGKTWAGRLSESPWCSGPRRTPCKGSRSYRGWRSKSRGMPSNGGDFFFLPAGFVCLVGLMLLPMRTGTPIDRRISLLDILIAGGAVGSLYSTLFVPALLVSMEGRHILSSLLTYIYPRRRVHPPVPLHRSHRTRTGARRVGSRLPIFRHRVHLPHHGRHRPRSGAGQRPCRARVHPLQQHPLRLVRIAGGGSPTFQESRSIRTRRRGSTRPCASRSSRWLGSPSRVSRSPGSWPRVRREAFASSSGPSSSSSRWSWCDRYWLWDACDPRSRRGFSRRFFRLRKA